MGCNFVFQIQGVKMVLLCFLLCYHARERTRFIDPSNDGVSDQDVQLAAMRASTTISVCGIGVIENLPPFDGFTVY